MSAVPVPQQVHYRPMRVADVAPVAAMERSLYAFPWSAGNFRDSVEAGYDCQVACEGTRIVGYAILMIALDEAHLLNLAVDADWQGRGIGRAFLEHMLGIARSSAVQIVYLEVRPSNLAARHLYRRAGFQQIAIRPAYYPALQGREDALFLGLTL